MVLPTPSDLFFKNYMNKKYSVEFGMASQAKLKEPIYVYNEYEFRGQKVLNIKALDLSLKASVIQKLN